MRSTRVLPCAIAACAVVAVAACGDGRGDARSAGPALQPIAMPDVTSASSDVQARVRAQYAALQELLATPAASSADRAAAFGELGKLFVATELFDAAATSLTNAQSLAPTEMQWPYLLAHTRRYQNDLDGAAQHFARALALAPDHVPTLVWLAEVRLAQNRTAEAEPLLARALTRDGEDGAVRFTLGRLALAKKDYSGAVTHLERALARAPHATRIHYPVSLAYRVLGNQAQADAHAKLRGEVDLPPRDPLLEAIGALLENAAAYESRGSRAIDARDWATAVVNFRKAVALQPANALAQLNLGTALYMQQDGDGALAAYRAALRVSPGLAKAHFGVGVVLESRGRDREAIEALRAAATHDPAYLEAHVTLANALRRNGQLEESIPHYERVLSLDPLVSQASFGIAMALVRLGRHAEARRRLETAVQAFPDQPGFAHALARVLAAAPDASVRDGARAHAIMMTLLQQQHTLAMAETMAMAWAELGRFDRAVDWQRRALASAAESQRPNVVAALQINLRLYQAGQPCRTPWADDDPVHHPVPAS